MAPTKVEDDEQVDIEDLFSVWDLSEEHLDESLAWQKNRASTLARHFRTGQAADSLYIIEMGTVKVMKEV